ncbi:MAG TPA: polysaccharide deacetylase family protein [Oceanipulchritudo sp.]|nr:polysaccharide deacetylase family protein [Oceanipulchritudo sp.]
MIKLLQPSLYIALLAGVASGLASTVGTLERSASTDSGEPGPIHVENAGFETDPAMASGTPSGWQWNESGGRGTSAGGTSGSQLFWQGNGSTIHQTTDHTITSVASPYTLTVDCRNSWFGSPKAVLYYEDGEDRVELGSAFLPDNGSTWSNWDTLTVSTFSTEASVGKKIGIALTMANYPGDRWAEFDNVVFINGISEDGGSGAGGSGGGGDPGPTGNPAAIPTSPDLSQGWISTRYNQILEELNTHQNLSKVTILFLGDSITQFWNAEGSAQWTANGFDDPTHALYALNLGEAGDRTEHILHRIQSAEEGGAGNLDSPDLNPETIVLMAGINNTWFHTNEEIIGGIKAVLESLAEKEPQATIILSSILPHMQNSRNEDRIIPINTEIAAYVESKSSPHNLFFMDSYPLFVDESGEQIDSYFKDGIHMTARGYAVHSTLLLPLLTSSLANYETWANDYEIMGGPIDDEDLDGQKNFYEYAFGGNPVDPQDSGMNPVFRIREHGEDSWMEYTFPKRSDLGNRAWYHIQTNRNPVSGLWINADPQRIGVERINSHFDAVTCRIPMDSESLFVRLLIEQSAPPEFAFIFPEGKSRALIMSYDDGPASDRKLIEIMDRYGIKGTFNLNSGSLGKEIDWLTTGNTPHLYLSPEEVASVYAGHEVASHTVNHPRLTELTGSEVRAEIANDVAEIERLTSNDVISFAYPFGAWNESVKEILRESGLNNARTTLDTRDFGVPADTLAWNPTTHDSMALDYVDEFLALDGDRMAIFFVWGHSWEYEIDPSERPWNTVENFSWASLEDFCRKVSENPDIWYAGAGEVATYLDDLKSVVRQGNGLLNLSGRPVWIKTGKQLIKLDPGIHTRIPFAE